MGTFILIIIVVIVSIFLLFVKDFYKDNKKIEKEGGIRKKYKVLIDHFINSDSNMIVLKESNMYCIIEAQHYDGNLTFRFAHTFDKININLEINHYSSGVHKLEWVFNENMLQEDMVYHIEKEIAQYFAERIN